jgi:alpha-L-fucosidase
MIKPGKFQGESVSALGGKDIRFTRNNAGNVVYAIVLGWSADEIVIQSLGLNDKTQPGKVRNVQLLGTGEGLQWKQTPDALRLKLPRQYRPTTDYAAALKVSFA